MSSSKDWLGDEDENVDYKSDIRYVDSLIKKFYI